MRERALAGDVTDRPQPVRGAHPLIDRHRASRFADPVGAQAKPGEVGAPAGGDQQPLRGERLTACKVHGELPAVIADPPRAGADAHPDAFPREYPGAPADASPRLRRRPGPPSESAQ